MATALTPQALYLQLGQLIAEMPDLTLPPTPETNRWVGRAIALVEAVGDRVNARMLASAASSLWGSELRGMSAQNIEVIIYEALAKAELSAPAGVQGAFIPAGGTFDAFAAVAKAVGAAKSDVLFIDPYADGMLLTDFATAIPEGVMVRILTDKSTHKPSLAPAIARWRGQYGSKRPLEVRLAPPRTLHDRLILLDATLVWTVGQSFKDLAERAHSSINRADPETAKLKIEAYGYAWETANCLP